MPSKRVKIQSQTMVDAIQERAASLAAAGHTPQSATTCAASELARGAWPKVSPQVSARVAAERERLQRLVADRRSSPPPTTLRDGCKEQLDEARRAVERRAIAPPSRPAATTKAAEPPKKGKKKGKKARKPSQALSAPSEAEEVQQDMEAEIKARLAGLALGGGDLEELQAMLTPSDSEMRYMVEAVDDDQSGTIDFEEFCLLMLRSERVAVAPDWLHLLFEDDDDVYLRIPIEKNKSTIRETFDRSSGVEVLVDRTVVHHPVSFEVLLPGTVDVLNDDFDRLSAVSISTSTTAASA